VLAERPEIEALQREVERERVPPACRQAFERAGTALVEGRFDEARSLLHAARAEANEHYRARIDDRLRQVEARTYEEAMRAGTRAELSGDVTDALASYAKAYAHSPRAFESLRRILRTAAPQDAAFARVYDGLLQTALQRAREAGDAAAWAEVSQCFGNDPRAQAALHESLVAPWADVVDATCSPSGLPRVVRDRQGGIVLRLVEPGTFWMGAADGDALATACERPRHRVLMSKPFWLGETEVTWEQWRRFAAATGIGGGLESASGLHPVVGLTWFEAEKFCAHWGMRLPTEAEWEYAARAGGSDAYCRYPWGDDPHGAAANLRAADAAARDADVFPGRDGFIGLAPVAAFPANPWGFHDLIGNAREFCADASDPAAYRTRGDGVRDPLHAGTAADPVVVRGGSFEDGPRNAGVATRLEVARDARLPWVGLRAARDVW
jgi:formylglycine-generating enzyme required for sulfatase activity